MHPYSLTDSRVLIFGGTGSLGKKLIERLIADNIVAVYSRDEAKHWTIKNELNTHQHIDNLRFYVGDVRDQKRISDVLRQFEPTHIVIAAALKQVDTCELSPDESVATNLTGTQNVINAVNALPQLDIKSVLFVSTDKACAPVNVYGMCKALSERIVTSQASTGIDSIKYLCVRYGNVLESRGSIIPLFRYQAENAPQLTVTDPEMTRYVMTLDDSVTLIEHTFSSGNSGETWIPKLKAMKIGDLAQIFAELHNKKVKIIGLRPGEKKHEELVNESESVRTFFAAEHYIIKPAFAPATEKRFTYSSDQDVMSRVELETHLKTLNIIDRPLSSFTGKNIEEIRRNK
jgi:UDP-N-acetylglucosamine 4,6-dehydratase/5-epimerase